MYGWCTKYALTTGVFPTEVRPNHHDPDGRYVYTVGCKYASAAPLQIGKTFFEKREDAERVAKGMAERKYKLLQKQATTMARLALKPHVIEEEPDAAD